MTYHQHFNWNWDRDLVLEFGVDFFHRHDYDDSQQAGHKVSDVRLMDVGEHIDECLLWGSQNSFISVKHSETILMALAV